jgi:adenylate cyclase
LPLSPIFGQPEIAVTAAQHTSDENSRTRERRIWPAAVAVVVLLVTLPVAVMLDLRDFTHQLSERQANDISKIITDIRTFYANDVVGRILQADPHTKITATDNYRDVAGAIPIPATFSLEIGRLTSSRDNTVRYEFVSD